MALANWVIYDTKDLQQQRNHYQLNSDIVQHRRHIFSKAAPPTTLHMDFLLATCYEVSSAISSLKDMESPGANKIMEILPKTYETRNLESLHSW